MGNSNLITVNHENSHFSCNSCDRFFNSKGGLLQHCREAACHEDEWCERCERLFVSDSALEAHLYDSSAHWECHFCGDDEYTQDDLDKHYDSHNYCWDCDTRYNNRIAHRIAKHYRCHDCEREFVDENSRLMHYGAKHSVARPQSTTSPSTHSSRFPTTQHSKIPNFQPAKTSSTPTTQHSIWHSKNLNGTVQVAAAPDLTVHSAATVPATQLAQAPTLSAQTSTKRSHQDDSIKQRECWGCIRVFSKVSAVIEHLESGVCQSRAKLGDIERWARIPHRSREYICDLNRKKYNCPNCIAQFDYLSGLFLRIETTACLYFENIALKKLKNLIKANVEALY